MTTTPTNSPIPSEDPRDLKFNAGKFDEVMTSDAHYYVDRFGVKRWTIAGFQFTAEEAIRNYGYITMDSFEDGATLTLPNQVLRYESTGEYYRWDGAFPKVVASGSTPSSTGGIGLGAWVSVGDASLRSELNSTSGAGIVKADSGNSVQQEINSINDNAAKNKVQSMSSISGVIGVNDGDTVKILSFHDGKNYGGGTFKWSSSTSKTSHNGGTIIDPTKTFPSTWDASGKNSWFTASASGTGCWIRVDYPGYYLAEWFGAIPYVIGESQDSTIEFQQVSNVSGRGGTWKWTGRHRITSFILIPEKQTFGSFGQMTSVSVELFDPTNFQGVHTSPFTSVADKVNSALFYDADSGEAFRCMEGAVPNNFLLYGKGYNTLGLSLNPALPHLANYYNTSGIRHGKYIRAENVTIILFSRAFDSNPWDTGGSYVGDYYSTYSNCEATYCNAALRVTTTDSYNTTFYNTRLVVNRLGDFGVGARNLTFAGGSFESFNEATTIRANTNLSFKDSFYLETFDTAFNGRVFDIIGGCSINIETALVYMNYISELFSTGGAGQSTAVGVISLTGHGNSWRRAVSGTATIYSVSGVPNKSIGLYGDTIYQSSGATVTYYSGSAPSALFVAPVVITS